MIFSQAMFGCTHTRAANEHAGTLADRRLAARRLVARDAARSAHVRVRRERLGSSHRAHLCLSMLDCTHTRAANERATQESRQRTAKRKSTPHSLRRSGAVRMPALGGPSHRMCTHADLRRADGFATNVDASCGGERAASRGARTATPCCSTTRAPESTDKTSVQHHGVRTCASCDERVGTSAASAGRVSDGGAAHGSGTASLWAAARREKLFWTRTRKCSDEDGETPTESSWALGSRTEISRDPYSPTSLYQRLFTIKGKGGGEGGGDGGGEGGGDGGGGEA